MTPVHKNFLALIAITTLISIAVFLQARKELLPQTLPSIHFTDMEGRNHTLAEFSGKPVILHFWASWCAPCIKEFPSLQKLQDSYRDKGLQVVAVSLDTEVADVEKFYQEHSVKQFSAYHDPGYKAFRALSLHGVPNSILINRRGENVGQLPGSHDWQDSAMQRRLDLLVAAPEKPIGQTP